MPIDGLIRRYAYEGTKPEAHRVVVGGSADYSVALPSGSNEEFVGVTKYEGDTDLLQVDVILSGIAPCTADSAISVFDDVIVNDATGKIASAGAVGSDSLVVGQAQESASADGDVIHVLLRYAVK